MRRIYLTKLLAAFAVSLAAIASVAPAASADGKNTVRTVETPAPLQWAERHPAPRTYTYERAPSTTYTYTERHPGHPPHPVTYGPSSASGCCGTTTRTVTRIVRRAAPEVRYVAPRREVQVRKVHRVEPTCCCCTQGVTLRDTTRYLTPGTFSGPYTGGVGAGISGGSSCGSGGVVIVDGGATRRFSGVTTAPAARFAFQPRQRVTVRKKMGGGKRW